MLLILDHQTTSPDWNLAAEEYLLTRFTDSVFRLWRNAPSIIVGRHQNSWEEVNVPYIRQHHIPVIRRLSGGGAVFHDLGNINYSFMEPKPQSEESTGTFKRCTQPILSALNHIGIEAYLSGRNDLLIAGKKFSGTAQCQLHGRVLLHGTLLYSSALSNLGEALKAPRSKFVKNAVPSTASPVCNICNHLPDAPSVEQFMDYLSSFMRTTFPNMHPYGYTQNDLNAIESIAASKYGTHEWNWGEEPLFDHRMEIKTPSGSLHIYYDTDPAERISRVQLFGDFVAPLDREAIESKLLGCTPNPEAITERFL